MASIMAVCCAGTHVFSREDPAVVCKDDSEVDFSLYQNHGSICMVVAPNLTNKSSPSSVTYIILWQWLANDHPPSEIVIQSKVGHNFQMLS